MRRPAGPFVAATPSAAAAWERKRSLASRRAGRASTHGARREIDLALVARVPVAVIAQRFGVSSDSVYRHGHKHVSAVQRAALMTNLRPSAIDLEALQRSEGESLLGQLVAQRATLQSYSAAAFEAGNVSAAISAERAVCDNLALVSKLLGMLIVRHEVSHTSLLVSPSYLELRETLLRVLLPHPAAARDVAAALHELEAKAAEAIRAKANGGGKLIEHAPANSRANALGSTQTRPVGGPVSSNPDDTEAAR
jgi:hypothetical protein